MGQYEWLVLTCRACRRLLKLPPAMAGKYVICTHCRTKISVPKDAPVIQESASASQNQIPVARQNDDVMSQIRGHEEWEVGQKPIGGDMEFRARLHTTSDPELQPDADKEMKRVNLKRRKMERTHPDFDDVDLERRKKRRRKSRASGAEFAETFTKGLVIAVIILVAVVGWLGWEKWNQPKPAAPPPKLVQRTTEPGLGPDGRPLLESRLISEYGPALGAAVRGFTSSKTVDEMLPFVRDRARVEPKIRAWYTEANPWRPIEINNAFNSDDALAVDGDLIVIYLKLPNGDTTPITLERHAEKFLVDWEAFTGYGEMTWEELREKRPQQPVLMRVIIERGPRTEYWNGAFANHTTHNCFQLRDVRSRYFLSGYTIRNSPVDIKVQRALQPAPAPSDLVHCYAIVRLSYPPGAESPQQVNIDEMLENGWAFRSDK